MNLILYDNGARFKIDDIFDPAIQTVASKALQMDLTLADYPDTANLVKAYNEDRVTPAQQLPAHCEAV